MNFRNYDSWKCTNPAEESAAAREAERSKLAKMLDVADDEISDDQLDAYLEKEYERDLAARELRDEWRREMEPWTQPYEGT